MTDVIERPETGADHPAPSSSGTIRPFTREDAPRVAEILQFAFKKSTRPAPQGMVDYIRRLYLDIPWAEPHIYARVMELPDGRISGFAGLTPLPLRFGDKRITVGVTSSLSVDSRIGDAMTAPRLVRHMRNSTPEGVLSDRSNLAAAAISRQLKSEVLYSYSQDFIRVLRPVGYAIEWVSRRVGPARWLAPLAGPFDRRMAAHALVAEDGHWAAPGKTRGSASFKDRPVSIEEIVDLLPGFMERYTLRPDFSREDWQFILHDASQKRGYGAFFANAVESPSGETVGLYLYHVRKGGVAQLLQAFSIPGKEGVILDRLTAHAMDQGAVALHGRCSPTFLKQWMDRRAFFYPDMWTIVYSPDKEVAQHFHAGTALFTGLVGENWIRLNGDLFS